jgi:hypothetical protein
MIRLPQFINKYRLYNTIKRPDNSHVRGRYIAPGNYYIRLAAGDKMKEQMIKLIQLILRS